jgi:ABC-type transporter Mla subunit MlaD
VSDAARTSEEQMKRVADSVEGYPDRIRDILEDTMEEFYSSSLAKSAETALRDGGESSRRIADAAERLPADVDRALATARDEAAKLLDEIAAKSAEFRGLLETYRQAAADTERSLAAGRAAIADANTLADKATATAAAWEKTATEAEKTIALVRDLVAENDAAPGPDDDFSFERLERLAGDTQQALAELRATIADARGLANDPALAAFEQRANAILDGAQDRVDASIDRAARWSLAVLAIAMVLGSGLIVLARKLRGSS